jgi:hypothetical protein
MGAATGRCLRRVERGRPDHRRLLPGHHFFASDSNADDYRDRHGLTGEVFSMPDAAVAGALVFGSLLASPLS